MSGNKNNCGEINPGIDTKRIAIKAKSNWSTIQNGAPLLISNLLLRNEPTKSPITAPYEAITILINNTKKFIGTSPPIK